MDCFRLQLRGIKQILLLVVLGGSCLLACTPGTNLYESFFNNTTSLGGENPGDRGNITVVFINNTPFGAIFTFGVYDPLNNDFDFRQFVVDPENDFPDIRLARLEGNTSSDIITFGCGRAFGIGDEEHIARIRDDEDALTVANEEALEPGIAFSDKPVDDPDANKPSFARVPSVRTLQGSEFQCESRLVYTFELDPDQPSGFRVDTTVVLP